MARIRGRWSIFSETNANRVMRSDVRVYPGDTIIVPRAGITYVLGNVMRPGGYIMHDNGKMTVLQAISEAQGFRVTPRTATWSCCGRPRTAPRPRRFN